MISGRCTGNGAEPHAITVVWVADGADASLTADPFDGRSQFRSIAPEDHD